MSRRETEPTDTISDFERELLIYASRYACNRLSYAVGIADDMARHYGPRLLNGSNEKLRLVLLRDLRTEDARDSEWVQLSEPFRRMMHWLDYANWFRLSATDPAAGKTESIEAYRYDDGTYRTLGRHGWIAPEAIDAASIEPLYPDRLTEEFQPL